MSKVKDYLGLDFLVDAPSVHAGKVGCCFDQHVRNVDGKNKVMLKLILDDVDTWFYLEEVTQL